MFKLRPSQYKPWLSANVELGNCQDRRSKAPRKKSKPYVRGQRGNINHNDNQNLGLEQGERLQMLQAEQCEDRPHNPNNATEQERMSSPDFPSESEDNAQGSASDANSSNLSDGEDGSCHCFHCREQGEQEEEFIFQHTQSYADKFNLHEKLKTDLNISKFEVLIMILTIVMRHGMTGQLVSDLLNFVNTIFGRPVLPKSNYIFQKLFSVDSALSYHFICDHCNLYLGEHTSFASDKISCPNCDTSCNVKPSILNEGTFFITLSLRQQMQELVDRAGHLLLPRARRTEEGSISDICDGKLYKALSKDGMPLSNPLALSLTIGTDGGQVFKNSSRNSMWPCQVICNDLVVEERFRPQNMMLAGLWFGKNSPEMSAFLKPLSEELKILETEGVKRTLENGDIVQSPVVAILCVCDSVAKAKIQNIVQYNGYFGCGYCLYPGVNVDPLSKVPQIRYPHSERKYPLRTEESVREAMTLANETSVNETGIKGLSPLLLFDTIHLVFGVPIDFLHAILLGCVKRLIGLWFDESSTGKRYYIKKFEKQIDEQLVAITPPSKISTRPKLISKRSVWKGKDYGNFLLFWGLACLEGFLPEVYLLNFKNLSNGIFVLLQESISEEELMQAENNLAMFVEDYNGLYGDRSMVYNIHLVTHLTLIVKMCGPLSMYSAFAFESGIGHLVKLVKGTNSVASQICKKYLVSKSLPHLVSVYEIQPSVLDYCGEILSFKRNKTSISVHGVTLLGSEKLHFLTQMERQLLIESGYRLDETVQTFNRAIYKGNVITSRAYTRPTKTNDTCVMLMSGRIGLVDLIMLVSEPALSCLIFFTPLRISPGFEIAFKVQTCAGNPFEDKLLLPFTDVMKKCIFFSVGNKQFITERPNQFERD